GRGKPPPAPHLKNRLPPLRDSTIFFTRRRYTPPEKNLNARNAHDTQVFVFFRKAENASRREQTKT
ncbi:MAG: hypothetical protein IKQ66_06220, partial [Treponema sp.]|nr:hypothetical protein [Treponema sp.]